MSAQNGVRIAAATGTADASAMLDVVSTTKGFLVPRMNLTGPALTNPAPVTSPATGLLVYNLGGGGIAATGFYYWNSTQWVQLSAGALSGSGTVDYIAKWTSPSAIAATTDGGMVGTSGTAGTTRALTILENGDTRVSFGSYPGNWTSALQIQNNDNTRFLWLNPLDNASGANSRFRVSGSGLDIYVGGGNDAGTYSSTFASNGTVGIGTTTPAYTLEVTGSSGTAGFNAIHKIGPTSPNPEKGMWNPIYTAIGGGGALYADEEFATGANSVAVYNNSGGTGVQHFWENGDGSQPNSSGKWVRIVNNGNATSPGYGGFYQTINARRNATFVQRFRAKLPVGYTLNIAENAQGTNNNSYWLTPTAGTGKWEEYIRVSHCGNTGTFSSGGHVYVTGSTTTFTWYLASCNIYEAEGQSGTKLINTYFAITPATTQTITSITPTIISGLSITLTPKSATSKFLIMAVVNGTQGYVCSTLIYRNGSNILSHANTNEPGSLATTYTGGNDGNIMRQHVVNYMDAPATTSAITYDIRHTSGWAGTAYTTYVNDRAGGDMKSPSTLTIFEFAY